MVIGAVAMLFYIGNCVLGIAEVVIGYELIPHPLPLQLPEEEQVIN